MQLSGGQLRQGRWHVLVIRFHLLVLAGFRFCQQLGEQLLRRLNVQFQELPDW